MGKCIGNCIKCDLVSNEDKVVCCSFQTLRQNIEIRSQLNAILLKLDALSSESELPTSDIDLAEAETPAVRHQEPKVKSK